MDRPNPHDLPVEELIRLALAQMDIPDDRIEYPSALALLHWERNPVEVYAAAQQLHSSENSKERVLFADIVGQLGGRDHPAHEEAVLTLLEMLTQESDPQVLGAVGMALGHLDDPRAVGPLVRLKDHPHEDVRFGVVSGLLGQRDPLAVKTLIELSQDPDRDVRDWATFGFGRYMEPDTPDLDTPEIRDALLARAADPDPEVRGEAYLSLAERKDKRVIEPIARELEGEFFGIWAVEAAGILGDAEFYSLVKALWARLDPVNKQDSFFAGIFQRTLKACRPRR